MKETGRLDGPLLARLWTLGRADTPARYAEDIGVQMRVARVLNIAT